MSDRIDFNSLLRWSMSQTDNTPYESREMTEEDRQFLLDAMDNVVMDEIKRIKVLLHVLRLPDDPTVLYQMNWLTDGNIPAVDRKHRLRTLLEMRQEDQRRKQCGEETIARENVSSSIISLDELIIRKKHDETVDNKSTSSSSSTTTTSTNNITSDELYIIKQSIPIPSFDDLKSIYKHIRDEKLDALDELLDRTARSDNSIAFCQFNGMNIIKNIIKSYDFEMASLALSLLGNLVQNQPVCQNHAIQKHLIHTVINVIDIRRYIPFICDSNNYNHYNIGHYTTSILPLIRNALFFLSSLLNNNTYSQRLFVELGGYDKIHLLLEYYNIILHQTQYPAGKHIHKDKAISELYYDQLTSLLSLLPSLSSSLSSTGLTPPTQAGQLSHVMRRISILFYVLSDSEYDIMTTQDISKNLLSQLETQLSSSNIYTPDYLYIHTSTLYDDYKLSIIDEPEPVKIPQQTALNPAEQASTTIINEDEEKRNEEDTIQKDNTSTTNTSIPENKTNTTTALVPLPEQDTKTTEPPPFMVEGIHPAFELNDQRCVHDIPETEQLPFAIIHTRYITSILPFKYYRSLLLNHIDHDTRFYFIQFFNQFLAQHKQLYFDTLQQCDANNNKHTVTTELMGLLDSYVKHIFLLPRKNTSNNDEIVENPRRDGELKLIASIKRTLTQ